MSAVKNVPTLFQGPRGPAPCGLWRSLIVWGKVETQFGTPLFAWAERVSCSVASTKTRFQADLRLVGRLFDSERPLLEFERSLRHLECSPGGENAGPVP